MQNNKMTIHRELVEPISFNIQRTLDKWLDIFEIRLKEGVDPVSGVTINATSHRDYHEDSFRGKIDGVIRIKLEISTTTYPNLMNWSENEQEEK